MGNLENLTIGAFARCAGVTVETVRFYQRKGLLPEPQRPAGRIRRYGEGDVRRLKFVKAAQGLGFTLDEIVALLKLEDGTHCDDARALAEQKLGSVREKLDNLRRIESALAGMVDECRVARDTVSCPLIASLQRGSTPRALTGYGSGSRARKNRP